MKMQALRDVAGTASTGVTQELVVMTYNVLAQCYVRSSFFPYCKFNTLKWKNRSKHLEVDNYNEFWAGTMQKFGYEGLFVKKEQAKRDGVAVFWNATELKVIMSKQVSMDVSKEVESEIDHELLVRAAVKGSVGVIVHFENLETHLEFVVATTHLSWDPMQEDYNGSVHADYFLRVVYKFITHRSDFKSAYSQYDSKNSEPKFTNVNGDGGMNNGKHVPRFVGTLDYIFYRSPRMQPAALMEIMSLEDATKEIALPSTISPSDHLPLLCVFNIKLK